LPQTHPCERIVIPGDLLWGADRHHLAAGVAAPGAEVDQPIGGPDEFEVVFDDDDAVAGIHQTLQQF